MLIDTDTQRVLATLAIDGAAARITAGQLDRKLYQKTNDVLSALGGSWNRKAKAHLFPAGVDVTELLEGALAAGRVVTVREAQQALGWFPTPDPIADQLVEMAEIEHGDFVLEPSAGEGAIVRAIQRATGRGAAIMCIERDPGRRAKLAAIEGSNVLGVDDFMDYAPGPVIGAAGPGYDAIVMNPPFCKSGKGDHLDHVRHAFAMLVPGGRLVSVLPSSVEFRDDRRHSEFRAWVEERGEIEALPAGSFKASGTGVNTCVARMVKR